MAADHHTDEAAELQAEEDERQRRVENPLAAEPEDVPGISDEELQERLAEASASCPVGGCSGPMCASSVLATRYAKILRQERLLAMAASALNDLELALHSQLKQPLGNPPVATVERSRAIRDKIGKERKEP